MKLVIEGKGSGSGLSMYKKIRRCPRRYRLDKEIENDASDIVIPANLRIGTYVHSLLEMYYKNGFFDPMTIEVEAPPAYDIGTYEEDWLEAIRLFLHYAAQFPHTEFGEVVGTEFQPTSDGFSVGDLSTYMGVPYTVKLDMAVRLGEQECERLKETRLMDTEPGVYILDHKTEERRLGIIVDKFMNELQFVGYNLAWNLAHPNDIAKGTIVNVIFKTKTPGFQTIVVPPPDEDQISSLKRFVTKSAEMKDSDEPNAEDCFSYFKMCPHLMFNRCNRV